MIKPFDLAELTEKIKATGLPIAEAGAEAVMAAVFAWVEESALIHPNVIVKAAIPLAIATIKPIVANELNKIDGVVG